MVMAWNLRCKVQVDIVHRHDLGVAKAGSAPSCRSKGPSEGSRRQTTARLPMRLRPSPRSTVVVVLPSPAGVGVMAVTRISLPSGRSFKDSM